MGVMKKPLEAAARLLRNSRLKQCTPSRDQSIAAQAKVTGTVEGDQVSRGCPYHNNNTKSPQNNITNKPYGAFNRNRVAGSESNAKVQPFSSMPSPVELPVVGSFYEYQKAGGLPQVHEYNRRRHEELGPIYRENIYGGVTVYVADPLLYLEVQQHEGHLPRSYKQDPSLVYNSSSDYPNNGVFFMDGEMWMEHRSKVNPILLKRKFITTWLHHVMTSCEDHFTERFAKWKEVISKNSGELPNADLELLRLSFDGLGHATFGRRYASTIKLVNQDIDNIVRAAWEIPSINSQLVGQAEKAKKDKEEQWINYEKSMTYVTKTCTQLAQLCVEQVGNLDHDNGYVEGGLLYALQSNGEFSNKSLVDLTTGFIATPEPIASTLSWTLNTIGQYPEEQEKMYEEIQEVCGHCKRITFADLDRLKSVKRVFKEVMRLYPSAPFYTRILPEESVIGGYQVPAEQIIAMSVYTSQRDPKYFLDPLRFWPDRWARTAESCGSGSADTTDAEVPHHTPLIGVLDPGAYQPFGFGKRSCLGRVVAEGITQFFLARVIQEFKVRSEEVKATLRTMLVPDRPLKISLTKR